MVQRAAHAEILAAIERLAIDEETVRKKLEVLSSLLESSAPRVAPADLDRFETRYLELRPSLKPNMEKSGLLDLYRGLVELERDLRRAGKGS